MSLNISQIFTQSLEIIRNGTIRKLGYGFLFAFCSNYGSILYHFRDKSRHWSKNHAMHSTPPLGSPSWNIVIWCGYTMVKKLRICLAVST